MKFAFMACLAAVAACAPTIEYGARPKTDALSKLSATVSKKEDIRLALGEPRGHGKARFAQDLVPRDLWFYEYVRTDGQTIDLKMLIVLLKDDVYDGHFWFSSVDIPKLME
jgi:hypothetical protein